MDKPKFTPEPWEVPNLHHHALYLPIYGPDGKIIAQVPCKDGHDEEAEANAVLMKTAPKMYSELEDLLSALENLPQVMPGVDFPAVFDKKVELRALLREARGELEKQK